MVRRLLAVMLALTMVLPPLFASGQDAGGELVLRVAMQDDIKGLNPLTVSDVWSWNVLTYIYDGPINANPETDELTPYIAVGSANLSGKADSWSDCAIGNFGYSPKSAWEDSAKQEAILFYDFTNVKWHDGVQMTIRDVMFSMHMAATVPKWSASMNPLKAANFTATGWLEVYKVWESPDGMQAALRFKQQEPFADFFESTLSTFLLPEHIWNTPLAGQPVDAKIWCDPDYLANPWQVAPATVFSNNPPIGSGPFNFIIWEKGQYSKISTWRDHFYSDDYRYKDYVGTDEYGRSCARQPTIDAITYKIYKTAEAAILALNNNDIDYIAWSVPPTFVQELTNYPGIALQQSPETGFFYMAYNMRNPSFGYAENGTDVGKPLRQAIAHCIDKDRIVTRLLLNLGIAGDGPVPPFSEWYNASIPRYDFDPEKAKKILADAGYKVKVGDTFVEGQAAIDAARDPNWWYNPNGTPIGSFEDGQIRIYVPYSNYDPRLGETSAALMITQQLRDIGINAKAMAMSYMEIVDIIDPDNYSPPDWRDFDMYILGWSIGSEPADYLHAFFHSSNADVGQNYPGYNNSTFDSVIDLARATGDPEERRQAIFEAQAAICYDLPYDVLYYRTNIEAYRSDRFTGWVVGSKGSIFNWQSLYNIRAPGPCKAIANFVSPASAVASNSTTPMTIFVRDQDGNPLSGALVKLNATMGKLSQELVNTTANGQATVMFTAPYADPGDIDAVLNGTSVTISIEAATYVDDYGTIYDPAPGRLTLVKVFPEGAEFLSVTLSADPDVIDPDIDSAGTPGFTYVEVRVTDQGGAPVQGASVALTASPAVPAIEPDEQVTDADGKATFKVTATGLPSDDGREVQYVLKAIAIHPEDSLIKGENACPVFVVDASPVPLPQPNQDFDGFQIMAIAFLVALVVINIFGVLWVVRHYATRRKKK